MTTPDIAELERLERQATQGRWYWTGYSRIEAGVAKGHPLDQTDEDEPGIAFIAHIDGGPAQAEYGDELLSAEAKANAALIPAMRNALRFLLSERTTLLSENEKLRSERVESRQELERRGQAISDAMGKYRGTDPLIEAVGRMSDQLFSSELDVARLRIERDELRTALERFLDHGEQAQCMNRHWSECIEWAQNIAEQALTKVNSVCAVLESEESETPHGVVSAYRDAEGWLLFDGVNEEPMEWPADWPPVIDAGFLKQHGVSIAEG